MKKIAVITNYKHTCIGGIEKYNRTLYTAFPTVEFTEYPIYKTDETKDSWDTIPEVKVDNSLNQGNRENFLSSQTYSKSKMEMIFKQNDIVIMSMHSYPKKWLSNPKTIAVQHMDSKYYSMLGKRIESWLYVFGFFFGSVFFNIGTISNSLKKANHTIFFAKETSVKTKNLKTNIALFDMKKKDIKVTADPSGQFTWLSRLVNQKDPVFASEIANLFTNMYIYGDGPLKSEMLGSLNNQRQYRGLISSEKTKNKLLSETKCMILTSKIEGFPFVIVEALSRGIPVIVLDTFESVKFFEKSGAVFSISSKNTSSFVEKMEYIDNLSKGEYDLLSKKAIDFAKEYLSYENFIEKWQKIIMD